jgi:predicted NBD/HSP70 family sugar kinase
MSDVVVAIDLGGTRFRVGAAPQCDPVSITSLGERPAPRDRESFLALVATQLRDTGATHLGLGVPGLAHGTVCTWIPNLPYLDGLDLAATFPDIRIALGNDAQFAMVAEATAGAAREVSDAILLAIGTGIGSAVLADRRIVAGSSGAACSFGWATADITDPGEDVSGWLERHASGRALDAAAQAVGIADGSALVAAARRGDARALAALEPPMRALGTALSGAVALLDPGVVILSGGVAQSLDVLGPLIVAALRPRLPRHLRDVALKAGHFGPHAGLVGAAVAGSRGADWRQAHG